MQQAGVTLIELIVVLAIVAILAVIGLPGMGNTIQSNKLTANTNELVGALNLARLEAIKLGANVRITSLSGGPDWASGFRVWRDANRNDVFEAGEEIRDFESIDSGLTLNGPDDTVVFQASGFTSMSAGNSATFSLCASAKVQMDKQISVNPAGRISVREVDCP